MVIGSLLLATGLVLTVVGVKVAAERPRPLNIAGAFLAPLGLIVAFLGVARLVW